MGRKFISPIEGLAGFELNTRIWERPCPGCGATMVCESVRRAKETEPWPIMIELRCMHGHKVTIEVEK